jgi:predicted RNA-binding Zn ribbon-like protein
MALPAWVPADETKPAPMPLLLVQSFVNTREADAGTDLLLEPASAQQWFLAAGLIDPGEAPLSGRNLDLVREVRESIRALLVYNGGGAVATESQLQPLADLTPSCHFSARMSPTGGVKLEADRESHPIDFARLLLTIRDTQDDGTWARLKACHNGDCVWAFYDRSHARRGLWCDMAVCGNRIKNRNLRARRR